MTGWWRYLVLHPRLVLAVSGGTCGSYLASSPARLPKPVHPPQSSTPLQSPAFFDPPRASRHWAPPLGFASPLRGVSLWRPYDGIPLPSPCRPRRFSRPRRFTPPHTLWVYFTPLPRPGFSLQGLSLMHSRKRLVDVSCPLVVGLVPLPTVAHRLRFPRPFLRALLRAQVRRQRYGV